MKIHENAYLLMAFSGFSLLKREEKRGESGDSEASPSPRGLPSRAVALPRAPGGPRPAAPPRPRAARGRRPAALGS